MIRAVDVEWAARERIYRPTRQRNYEPRKAKPLSNKHREILLWCWEHWHTLYPSALRIRETRLDEIGSFEVTSNGGASSSYDYAMTLEEIGKVFGVSRERIREIEQRAMSKLREAFESLEKPGSCADKLATRAFVLGRKRPIGTPKQVNRRSVR